MNAAILSSPVVGAEAAPPDHLLAVEALTVSFDGFKAVNDVSFYVDPDETRPASAASSRHRRSTTT